MSADALVLRSGGLELDCRAPRVHVMGVLNVTPDSFWDGGRYDDPERAMARARSIVEEGAAIIDVGGESTRPKGRTYGEGAQAVGEAEELGRVIPVVERIAREFPGTWISVDTYKPEVARRALEAGAHMINDVTAGRWDRAIWRVVAEASAVYVAMHSVGLPGEMPHEAIDEGAPRRVEAELGRAIEGARVAGVRQVIVDPGFGFGKTTRANLALLGATARLRRLGAPVMVAVSRKASIGALVAGAGRAPAPPEGRLFGSIGAAAAAAGLGASIVRAHDVRAHVEALRLFEAVRGAR